MTSSWFFLSMQFLCVRHRCMCRGTRWHNWKCLSVCLSVLYWIHTNVNTPIPYLRFLLALHSLFFLHSTCFQHFTTSHGRLSSFSTVYMFLQFVPNVIINSFTRTQAYKKFVKELRPAIFCLANVRPGNVSCLTHQNATLFNSTSAIGVPVGHVPSAQ